MTPFDSLVIGAGQAGLSASFHLRRLGIEHVVLDANPHAGGAWQHRWDSLTMGDVHGVADLPDAPAPGESEDRANEVIACWFDDYEQSHDLPVLRPVRVDRVTDDAGLLVAHAGDRTWTGRTLVNATGTWTHPFVPSYPGPRNFAGEQWHTVAYPGREHFRGMRVVVVGGGASAVQFIGELTPIAHVQWVIAAVADGAKGAIPGVPVVDTIKVVDDAGQILATPAREGLRAVQTPQGFDRAVLEQAHAAGAAATDDAALVEALGHAVLVVAGDPRALKITTPADLAHAERLLTTASP